MSVLLERQGFMCYKLVTQNNGLFDKTLQTAVLPRLVLIKRWKKQVGKVNVGVQRKGHSVMSCVCMLVVE